MSKATQKGTTFETQFCDYCNARLGGKTIERRAKHGTNDMGDISGVFVGGKPCVVECKNRKSMSLAQWVDEAEIERGNADAEYGVVAHKRPGAGTKNFGRNYVTMTLDTWLAILAGGSENLEEVNK